MACSGTGFVVDSNTVVTAGHNVWNRKDRKFPSKHAVEVQVHIGYEGAASCPLSCIRKARSIAVGWDYYQKSHKLNDVAVITLDKPFEKDQILPMNVYDSDPFVYEKKLPNVAVGGYPGICLGT